MLNAHVVTHIVKHAHSLSTGKNLRAICDAPICEYGVIYPCRVCDRTAGFYLCTLAHPIIVPDVAWAPWIQFLLEEITEARKRIREILETFTRRVTWLSCLMCLLTARVILRVTVQTQLIWNFHSHILEQDFPFPDWTLSVFLQWEITFYDCRDKINALSRS